MRTLRIISFALFLVVTVSALSNSTVNAEESYIYATFEDLEVEIDYNDLRKLRHKNFNYIIDSEKNNCIHITVLHDRTDGSTRIYARYWKTCITYYVDEYVFAPTEIIQIGSEYETAAMYLYEAIEQNEGNRPGEVARMDLLRLGLQHFLAVRFPDNPLYALPTPTPTPTLTPTATSTSTLTPTPTTTSTPTQTSTPTPTSTSTPTTTPEPTITSTPTQATLLIVANNFINDLQEGENSYLIVILVLIILLVLISIGVLIYKRIKSR